jgi:hypothetical protein
VEKLKAQLDEWNADLDKLESKFRKAEASVKIEQFEQLNELRQRTATAQQTLAKIQEVGDDAWEDLKQGAENVWNELGESFSRAKSEFKRVYRRGLEE